VALAGALPDRPLLWATREDGGWRLDGRAPLVTGWGLIDLVQVAARDVATAGAADTEAVIVTALLDARAAPGLAARPLALLAADASRTVQLQFDGVHLPDDRVSGETTRAAFLAGMTASSRVNGALALGVTGRCVRLIADAGRSAEAGQLAAELDRARAALDAALAALATSHVTPAAAPHPALPDAPQSQRGHLPPDDSQQGAPVATPGGATLGGAGPSEADTRSGPAAMATARAAASELAHRAAGALVVATGSRALLDGHPAGRLLREAAFTLVAAGRDEIRADLLARMTAPREIDVPGT
jgi:alkylation response protein AidB-like acyl-CoA dehydrogenase